MSSIWITNKEFCELHDIDYFVLWAHFPDSNKMTDVFSVPKDLDENFELYRGMYLKWLSNLKNKEIKDVSVLNLFDVRTDFSLWWMSLLVEKSQWKSPCLHDVFKLLALQSYLQNIKNPNFTEVNLDLGDRDLELVIRGWFKINWPNAKVISKTRNQFIPYFMHLVSHIKNKLKFIFYIFYQFYIALILSPCKKHPLTKHQVSIFSYFFNLDKNKLKKGKFVSGYWEPLYQILDEFNYSYNWHHLYLRRFMPGGQKNTQHALSFINHNRIRNEYHNLIQSHLNIKLFFRSFFEYCHIRKKCPQDSDIAKYFSINKGFNFWLLLQKDWHESFKGKLAFENCLLLNSFEKLCCDLGYQKLGMYLLENQAWERALVYAWKKFGHGQLIGVQHATISDGDLRFYQHKSEYDHSENQKLPLPDFIGVNGNASLMLLKNTRFPEDKILKLEALRYLYLAIAPEVNEVYKSPRISRLLVLGDYSPVVSNKLINFLNTTLNLYQINLEIYIKNHPAHSINIKNWPKIKAQIIDEPLSDIHNRYDIAISSSSTSASVDVYLAKKPIIIMRETEKINMCPLRKYSGVRFVSLPSEFAECIKYYDSIATSENGISVQDYFYLDKRLPKYRKILKSNTVNVNE